MRVGVDQDRHSRLGGRTRVHLVEVAAVRRGVDLEHRAGAGGRLDQPRDVDRVGLALLDLAPGRVADRVDQRMLDGGDHALGHLVLAHPERGVDGRDHPVELLEHGVLVVQRAVGEDVGLGPDQQPDPVEPRVQLAHAFDLAQQLLRRHVIAEPV
jgi:hypothetical protein